MARSDSMFLFEITVEELNSFVTGKQFLIKSQFADIFSLILKDPIEVVEPPGPIRKKISKSKTKVKTTKGIITKQEAKPKVRPGQSILFISNIDRLISHMLQYPMEISLWSIEDPKDRIGSAVIPWNPAFVDFLARLYKLENPPPVIVKDVHNVFNEITSKRMASIKINIRLSHMKDEISPQFSVLSEEYPNTFIYTEFESKPVKTLSLIKPRAPDLNEDTGIIKTIYRGKIKKKNNKRSTKKNNKITNKVQVENRKEPSKRKSLDSIQLDNLNPNATINKGIISFIKSETDIVKTNKINLLQTKSCSSIKPLNALNYIFGDRSGPFGSRIYTVGYFTVKTTGSNSTVAPLTPKTSEHSQASKPKYKVKLCTSDCPSGKEGDQSECSIDLPAEAAQLISVTKCENIRCDDKKDRELIAPPDDRILIGLHKPVCLVEKEEVVGMTAQIKVGNDPCFCACECHFGFGRRTTYCNVCGGYEQAGDDLSGKPQYLMPVACPIYHKIDKIKAKTSTSGSESKKIKHSKSLEPENEKHSKSFEPENEKKGKKKKKDDRFKFNYGYKAPQIGHSQCGMPCTGTLSNVPKSMGWLWTADNVPGLKFRPLWKPGAANKFVVRLLKIARNPDEVSKKRRKDTDKKKRPPKRPLLVVHKKDGEYSVTMETMKAYSKPRALNQQPYEDKDPITYTIGRTEEENRDRRKKKERRQRRLEREQRDFIQSAFRDMCEDICLKTYQQALEILPETEDPKCPCYPADPGPDRVNLERSCSCSEDEGSLSSDTDSDEWIVEFTPPVAQFDPKYTGKKIVKCDNESQYTYLDYRVKLLDRFGNQVPRFFKGLDGKQQCSDLGGFWSPDHEWLQINVDGYIAPDGRWAPLAFIGPNGEQLETDLTGKFQAANGNWLVVGVDGFIDSQGKWKYYSKPRKLPDQKKKRRAADARKGAEDKKAVKNDRSWSCFGDVSPKELSKMGIVGHGPDRKLLHQALSNLLARGEEGVTLPQVSRVPKFQGTRKKVPGAYDSRTYFSERTRCKHPVPSSKGIVSNERGRKTYYQLKAWRNWRPQDRLHHLDSQGRSVSSFHEPCFHSFIDRETMKQRVREHRMKYGGVPTDVKGVGTQSFLGQYR